MELGFTIADVRSVLSTGGRIPDSARDLRAAIDARFLEMQRAGTNMAALQRHLGITDIAMTRALWRARGATWPYGRTQDRPA